MTSRIAKAFVICAVVLLANAWSLPASGAERDVILDNGTQFIPPVVQANPQDTVRWTSRDGAPHTVTHQSSNPTFDSHPNCTRATPVQCMEQNDQYSLAVTGSSDIPYYCKVHGALSPPPDPSKGPGDQPCGMCGLVDVTQEQINPTPSPPPTPRPTHPQRPDPTPTPLRFGTTPTPAATGGPGAPGGTMPSPSLGLPSPTASLAASPSGSPGSFAAPDEDTRDGGAGRTVAIIAGIGALAAAGGLAWYSLLRGR